MCFTSCTAPEKEVRFKKIPHLLLLLQCIARSMPELRSVVCLCFFLFFFSVVLSDSSFCCIETHTLLLFCFELLLKLSDRKLLYQILKLIDLISHICSKILIFHILALFILCLLFFKYRFVL